MEILKFSSSVPEEAIYIIIILLFPGFHKYFISACEVYF